MSSTKISRRQALKLFAGAAAGAVASGALPVQAKSAEAANWFSRSRLADYQGKVVVYSLYTPQESEGIIKGVEEALPGVKLDWRNLTSEKYVELFSGAELAGDQIDVMHMNGQDIRRYATGGKLTDLSDLAFKDRFLPVAFDPYTINGKLWGVPHGGMAGFTFLYNKKLLEKVGMKAEPETYDDLLKLAPELKKLGAVVFTHQGKNIYLWPVWQFWAYAQTTGNKAVENTFKTLRGEMKFTDPEHVAALEILYKFTKDGMFTPDVLSLDTDSCQLQFFQGKALFWYWGPWQIGPYRKAQKELQDIEMSVMTPVRAVADKAVKRQLPGSPGNPIGIYSKIAPERMDVAKKIVDLMTSDKLMKWFNQDHGDPVSVNKNVQASDDPIALKYAKECAPNQFTYLDWYWPPEITRAFQEQQQAIVAGKAKPDEAAKAIQKAMDDLRADGYDFDKKK